MISQERARTIRQCVADHAQMLAEKVGMYARTGPVTLEDTRVAFKVELLAVDEHGSPLTPERAAFELYPPPPLTKLDLFATFLWGTRWLRVVGCKAQWSPRSVVCEDTRTGDVLRFSPQMVYERLHAPG